MHEIEPAFLVEAEKLLQEGKSREAAVLCTRGLAKYPEYYTAYAVLIRALEAMGDYEQMQEVYDSAPNVIKFNIKNSRLKKDTSVKVSQAFEIENEENTVSEEDKEEENDEPDDIFEIDTNEPDSEVINDDEIESEVVEEEQNNDLEKEIHQAIRNDDLNPEIVSDLIKSEKSEQEEIDIKETLTLAKIYEQQDAFEEALIIYKQLQEITPDKSKYADKILELQTLVDEEKK
jgi:tetratricopeptide (TPR) repeat protein